MMWRYNSIMLLAGGLALWWAWHNKQKVTDINKQVNQALAGQVNGVK